MTEVETITRTCRTCGETKPGSEFYRSTRSPGGLSTMCKTCEIAVVQAANERRRATMGDEAYRAYRAAIKRKSYAKTGSGRLGSAARSAALERLAVLHERSFRALLAEERAARGLDPRKTRTVAHGAETGAEGPEGQPQADPERSPQGPVG